MSGMSETGTVRARRKAVWQASLGILLTALAVAPCLAASKPKALPKPTTEDCLICHGDKGLSTERDGKAVSLFVDPDKFKASMHGAMFTCVDCHTDLKSSPHESKPAKVECMPLGKWLPRPSRHLSP